MIAKTFTEIGDMLSSKVNQINDVLVYLSNFPDSTSEASPELNVDNIYLEKLSRKVKVLSYYAHYHHDNFQLVSNYHAEMIRRIQAINSTSTLVLPRYLALLDNASFYNYKKHLNFQNIDNEIIVDAAYLVLTNLSSLADLLYKLSNTLYAEKDAILGPYMDIQQDVEKTGSSVEIYLCIKRTLLNSNKLKPDNLLTEKFSPLALYMGAMKSSQLAHYNDMVLAENGNDKYQFSVAKEEYEFLTNYIEKKLKKVVGITRNSYLDVIKIEQDTNGYTTLILRNLNAYISCFDWVTNYTTVKDASFSDELLEQIYQEFVILTEYGIAAESDIIFT
ncbi:hypothetical protein AX774_g6316 [Zancudomyces culisetae]|uniref:Uncharacterized protein n=1 Tax=Zancudomyces culisetae TaxID=1213189 RepID=A0A1R1PH01_ZANCU|nr:hypothetical protein AX774_g6316 [Zancudomyces culisetae]|eukprot:OMH80254.1 hypothetical protein AX774_g6316 [Zancudomyces culisetae]